MIYFPDNSNDWKKIASVIKRSETIYISTHVNLDGDAIGSEIAFAEFLRTINKTHRIINHSCTPEIYTFLDPENSIETFSENEPLKDGPEKGDTVIFLDMGSYKRAGNVADFLVQNEATKIIIDHHPPEPVDADIIVVNPHAAATGSLLYDFFCFTDISSVNERIASALLTAIVTDTGYFRYSNTTHITHLIASSLYNHGASTSIISKKIEAVIPLPRQILLGLTLAHVQISDCGRIAYSSIIQSMFDDAGAQREHTDGIIEQIRNIKNIKIAILFIQEEENNFKVSLRSTGNIPVNTIASMFGGGGHTNAAGANLHGSLEDVISKVLGIAEKLLNNQEKL